MDVNIGVPPRDLVLDPFSYVPDMKSRIEGLGGHEAPRPEDYVFHTPYVEAAEGIAHFTIQFDGLIARSGTLNLRVHMMSSDSPHARLATAERVAFNRLVDQNGRYQLRFEAFHGVSYALYGGVIGDTDAAANGLHVVLDRPADPNERREHAAEARDTAFHSQALPVANIVSLAPAGLVAPVTQFATLPQLREKTGRDLIRELGHQDMPPLDQWREAYVMQVLRAYGVAEPGARGAALGSPLGDVARILAGQGVAIEVVLDGDDPVEGEGGVGVRRASLDPLAPELVNYDFLWSDGLCDRMATPADGRRFIEAAMACLRPGGLAVHVGAYDPDDRRRAGAFVRSDIEQTALILISRGHEVAEFRIDRKGLLVGEDGLSAWGFVCRKATLDG